MIKPRSVATLGIGYKPENIAKDGFGMIFEIIVTRAASSLGGSRTYRPLPHQTITFKVAFGEKRQVKTFVISKQLPVRFLLN
jgi:hypothetical protein